MGVALGPVERVPTGPLGVRAGARVGPGAGGGDGTGVKRPQDAQRRDTPEGGRLEHALVLGEGLCPGRGR